MTSFDTHGFTLLELLVSIAIVSIIAAIAVPQYRDYKTRAFDVRAQLEVRNVATAEEVYFLDNEEYLTCVQEQCLELPGLSSISDGVQISVNALELSYVVEGSHAKGSGEIFQWDSDQGGFTKK